MILMLFQNSCTNMAKESLPEILTAEYELKNFNGTEQGFSVFMVIAKIQNTDKIKSILLKNNRFDSILTTQMTENEVFIDQFFPVNSQLISEFKSPETDSRSDGIVFEINGQEFFKEINFKLKTEK
ncbi:MAG: hypothetical protein WBF83_03995 [Moheibacter sp.]